MRDTHTFGHVRRQNRANASTCAAPTSSRSRIFRTPPVAPRKTTHVSGGCAYESNKYGFIESPYRKVENGRVTDEVVYLSAMEEARFRVAQATITIGGNGAIEEDLINCRVNGDFEMVPP